MNAVFTLGKVKVGTEAGEVEKNVELVTLSGGFLLKDEITRVATDDDRLVYAEEYKAFKSPPSPPASAGASTAAAAPSTDAAGAPGTAQPLGG